MAQGAYLSPSEQAANKRKRAERLRREQQRRDATAQQNRSGLARSQGPSGGPTYAPTRGGPNRSGQPVSRSTPRNNTPSRPSSGSALAGRTSSTPVATLRQQQNDALRNHPANRPAPSPAASAPVHASPRSFGSNTQVQGGVLSAQPSAYAPQAGAAPRPNTPQPSSSSYRDGGKGLYKGSEEYVKATGGNYNPLMQRTFGYQTGGHPGAQPAPAEGAGGPAAPNPNIRTMRTGTDFGGAGGPAPDIRQSRAGTDFGGAGGPDTPMSPQYNGNDEPGSLGQAENPMLALAQQLLNRRKLSISVQN